MKKKFLILAAVAVSGLAVAVASNTNNVFGGNNADASVLIEIFCGNDVYDCYSGGPVCISECLAFA